VARWPLKLAIGVCSLAAGCCCPALSGRYCEVGLPPPAAGAGIKAANTKCENGDNQRIARQAGLKHGHSWLGRGHNEAVPSQQQFDYLSPLPKFHPAPTHPVFEAQMHYLPPSDPTAKAHGAPSEKH
jgi:hypothetical protein